MSEKRAGLKISARKKIRFAAGIVASFLVGYVLAVYLTARPPEGSGHAGPSAGQEKADSPGPAKEAKKPDLWTCSMHPQIRLPNPGKCPICFMDLIPLEMEKEGGADAAQRVFTMSEAAKKLAEVETAEVKRAPAKVNVSMAGMVYEDETRVAALTSRVEGRIDVISVSFTGVMVNVGDPMVTIWSPTLIKSQVELFEALRTPKESEAVISGAEEKLIQLGLTREQVEEIKQSRKTQLYVTLRAPISGVVMKKLAVLGQFVKEGQEMYVINDLSRVWVKMDAYETDMPWIRYGQEVTFTTPSVPGRRFTGRVLFIDPTLDVKTRSVKIRVEADNPDLSLKPGMFVSAALEAEIDHRGRVIKSEWAGKYICPIHPRDEVSEAPGVCPDSKMAFKPASLYGYSDDNPPVHPLGIPASAPLITGKRSVVYVEVPAAGRPSYELREVVLGPRAGEKYVVYEGLKEGERVVTRGNFKIDSAMQILGRPSMMSPPGETPEKQRDEKPAQEELIEKIEAPAAFLNALTPTIAEYFTLKEALVDEKADEAAAGAKRMTELMDAVKSDGIGPKASEAWKSFTDAIRPQLKSIAQSTETPGQRNFFGPLSETFVRMLMTFRHAMNEPLIVLHCPMAFDAKGAYWVERGEGRRNPYFGRTRYKGQDMLQCGELVDKIPPEVPVGAAKARPNGAAQPQEPERGAAAGKEAPNTGQDPGAKLGQGAE
jgi:Cu(I)/Ag(I) efflux system membrane fusion protein